MPLPSGTDASPRSLSNGVRKGHFLALSLGRRTVAARKSLSLAVASCLIVFCGAAAQTIRTGHSPWGAFVRQTAASPAPNFSQQLSLNLSDKAVASVFINVMGKTQLEPQALANRTAARQASMIQAAVGGYAESVLLQAKQSAAQAAASPSVISELQALRAIGKAVPAPQRKQVVRYEKKLAALEQLKDSQIWAANPPQTLDAVAAGAQTMSAEKARVIAQYGTLGAAGPADKPPPTDLVAIESKVLVRPAYSDYADSGYHMPYPIVDKSASKVEHTAVLVGADIDNMDTPDKEFLLKTFEAFDELIESNFQALELLARSAGSLDKAAARTILEHTARMVASYLAIAGGSPTLEAEFKKMRSDLESRWSNLPDRAPLPKEIARKGAELKPNARLREIRSLHTLINYIHQNSFLVLTETTRRIKAAGRLTINGDIKDFTNLSSERVIENGRFRNPLLQLIAIPDLPKGHIILKDDQLWYHVDLGHHTAEIHVKLAEPDEGGLLSIRYSEGGSDFGNQLRRSHVAELLRLFGAPSTVKGDAFLTSSWDKDHGLTSKAQIEYALPRLLKALVNTRNLDVIFEGLAAVKGYGEAEKTAHSLAAAHVAHGSNFFDSSVISDSSNLYLSYLRYLQDEKKRTEFRATLNRELARLGLPEIPTDMTFGQEVIDAHFTSPIKLALARGELALDSNGVPQRTERKPIEALAKDVLADEESALRTASALSGSENFEAVGGVGRLRAEKAQWLWEDNDGLVVYALRDLQSQALAYASAYRWDGASLKKLSFEAMVDVLKLKGVNVFSAFLPGAIQRQSWHSQLTAAPLPMSLKTTALGLAASSGEGSIITGRAVFRKEGALDKDGIFLAPFTTPDDLELMRQAAAVVTTGGGLLSHAAITTRELGIAAVILNNARWTTKDGKTTLDIEIAEPGKAVSGLNGLWITPHVNRRHLKIKEGDVIRVDGRQGLVSSPLRDAPGEINRAIQETYALLSKDAGTLASSLGLMRGPPQTAAAEFVLEEALWNPALAGRKNKLVTAVMNVNAQVRRHLEAYGRQLLKSRAAEVERKTGQDLDITQDDVNSLSFELQGLSALAATLNVDRSPLRTLEARLQEWRGLTQTVQRRAVETLTSLAHSFTQRLHTLQTTDLPELRALIRNITGTDLNSELTALRARADALAKQKKAKILSERPSVIPLENVDDDFAELIGGKSAKLGQIMNVVSQQGSSVPPGVALTTEAYLRFLRDSGIQEAVLKEAKKLDAKLADADLNDAQTLKFIRQGSARIQELIKSVKLTREAGLGKEILDSLRASKLDTELFAVRSSAVQEDRPEAAFAGAAETFLYVDFDGVLDRVVEGWASFWLPRGIQYRWQQGIRSVELLPAITVQKMANAEAAGVLFTVNPVNGRRDIIINAAYGLGEGIVSGLVQADQYLANRKGEELVAPVLGNKTVKIVRTAAGVGTQTRPVPGKERKRRALTPEQIRQLTRVGTALEDYFGYPLDIEFAIEGEEVVILQARPVTASGVKAQAPKAAQ